MKFERKNAYFCKKCRKVTITVDVDEGVTPMFILCPDCRKQATSMMYQLPLCMRTEFTPNGGITELPAQFEWYRPDKKEIEKLSKGEKEHVKQGGLLMRKRTGKQALIIEAGRFE